MTRATRTQAVPVIWPGAGLRRDFPGCSDCTWVWRDGQFQLKFAHAACPQHFRLVQAGET